MMTASGVHVTDLAPGSGVHVTDLTPGRGVMTLHPGSQEPAHAEEAPPRGKLPGHGEPQRARR